MLAFVALVLARPHRSPSPEAAKYLGDALDLIQKNSRMRNTEWAAMRQGAFERARDARTPADTYPAIKAAIEGLNDHHSGFYSPEAFKLLAGGRTVKTGLVLSNGFVAPVPGSPAARAGIKVGTRVSTLNGEPFSERALRATIARGGPVVLTGTLPDGRARSWTLRPAEFDSYDPPSGRVVRARYGYLKVPGLQATDAAIGRRYATAVQDAIRKADRKGLHGWIVDLRVDTGGNCWPMLAGLGPLFPPGRLGSFVGSDGSDDWTYRDGKSFEGGTECVSLEHPYTLRDASLPIVVLQGPLTASSGEVTLVAFRGMANVVFVGEPSRGLPTANSFFSLADGAVINLCTAADVDRTGRVYDSGIPPDVSVANDWSRWGRDDDPAIQAAIRSIEARRSSSGG